MTTIVTTAIDITAYQACVIINGIVLNLHKLTRLIIPIVGVPYEHGLIVVPSKWCDGQFRKIDLQTVFDFAISVCVAGLFAGASQYTTFVGRVILAGRYVCIITTAHELLEDVQTTCNLIGVLARNRHTAHITAAVEGTDVTRIILIVIRVTIGDSVEHDTGLQVQGDSFHIVGKHGFFIEL